MRTITSVALVMVFGVTAKISAQEIRGLGMLSDQMWNRVRGIEDVLFKGDLVRVEVIQPGNHRELFVSIHAEYLKNGSWKGVPVAQNSVGVNYKSAKYEDFRDYVKLSPTGKTALRSVALFMPYDAAESEPPAEPVV